MHDSHIGGPLMWPSAEPWPACDRTVTVYDRESGIQDRTPESPVPMVGVAQFYARDFPEIPFPEGADLLQVLWCPNSHLLEDTAAPFPLLVWRRTSDVIDVMDELPMRHYATPDSPPGAPAAELSEECFLPRPCVLHPERITEYPESDELPEQLQRGLDEWDDEAGLIYGNLLSIAPGCKIGGWISWNLTDMYELPCNVCGTKTQPFLKLDSSEWDIASEPRWRPVEERHLEWGTPEYKEAHEPTTLEIGRYVALVIFLCPRSSDHGYRLTLQ
ncbi:hypothetical protein ACQP2T_20655 [Nonomuraea sp. CA-143628]|uniref:hypothetical protein n=1 Tax=Nonomuraea sp. CA-143628 TaxID=3239997 RepID=UPI003D8D2380